MPSTTLKRRRTEEALKGRLPKKTKKIKKQKFYHSSSEDEEEPEGVARDAPRNSVPASLVDPIDDSENPNLVKPRSKDTRSILKPSAPQPVSVSGDTAAETALADESEEDLEEEDLEDEFDVQGSESEDSDASEASSISGTSTNNPVRKVRKRNDPEAFATSISKILNTKLTSQKRSEPILSRSKSAQETHKALADHKLTLKANRQLLAEKRAAQEKGRVKDVLGLKDPSVSTADVTTHEKALRRTAQRGVIKLFNAVRAAQVKGEQAEREAREKGVVGMGKREEQVKEMSKQGFLDMITGSAKKREQSIEA